MPILGIDCRFAAQHAGLGTYTRGMVQALLRRNDPWSFVLFVKSADEGWLQEFALKENIKIVVAPFPHYSFGEQWKLPMLIRNAECDLMFFPHFNVPLFCDTPFVCTIHDLILHRFPNDAGFLKRMAYRLVLGSAVRRAKAITTISEATKKDIVNFYPNVASKISVIHPGIDEHFVRAADDRIAAFRSKYSLPQNFLLYIGNYKQHKNVPMLLRAFALAKLDGIELVLLSVGKESNQLSLTNFVRNIADVADDDLPALLSGALGLVTASLMEGFGLPMVEAMAVRTPVLAARSDAVAEICGDHALLVEPAEQALAEGLRKLVSDPSVRDSARLEAAQNWAKRYNWDAAARSLSDLLQESLPHR